MRTGAIHREGVPLVASVPHAERWWSRLRGLLGRPALRADGSQGLLITPCASIHTCGMGYRIDAVFLDAQGTVLACHPRIATWRFRMARGARSVLELAEGAIGLHDIQPGHRLSWVPAQETPR